jgi:DNA-binding response OmpR family regulator
MVRGAFSMPTNRILCVDDSDDIRELLRVVLGYAGFEAVGASNASEARRLMEGEQFGLYIIDWQLPGASGLTLCEEVRARNELTPIIIFSGRAYESDRTEGMRAGANVYLCKPDVSKLIPSVTGLLEQPSVACTEGNLESSVVLPFCRPYRGDHHHIRNTRLEPVKPLTA